MSQVIKNSFKKPPKVLSVSGSLQGVKLLGNVVVVSSGTLTIHSNAQIEDALIIAPKVVINSGFKGSLQILASQSIEVKSNVKLSYPSSLVVLAKNNESKGISIESNTKIQGVVTYLQSEDFKVDTKQRNKKPQIYVADQAVIQGQVYNQNSTEFYGSMYGSMYTKNFVVHYKSMTYLNHLLNAKFFQGEFNEFSGLDFSHTSKNLAKWMY